MPLQAIIGCGPSGSGKSSYLNNLLLTVRTHHICPDKLRERLCGDESDQSRNHEVFSAEVPREIAFAHEHSLDIVYDATNTTRKARKAIIAQLKPLGYLVTAHVFHVPIEECKRRNAGRARQVPVEVIMRQFAQWQEPALEEGLDSIVNVEYIPAP